MELDVPVAIEGETNPKARETAGVLTSIPRSVDMPVRSPALLCSLSSFPVRRDSRTGTFRGLMRSG
jgi:hypothetical protein